MRDDRTNYIFLQSHKKTRNNSKDRGVENTKSDKCLGSFTVSHRQCCIKNREVWFTAFINVLYLLEVMIRRREWNANNLQINRKIPDLPLHVPTWNMIFMEGWIRSSFIFLHKQVNKGKLLGTSRNWKRKIMHVFIFHSAAQVATSRGARKKRIIYCLYSIFSRGNAR